MPRLPRVTARKALQVMKRAGWREERQRGSHLHLVHPEKPERRVTISIHAREIVLPKTLEAILEQADMSVDEFRRLM
jgi:predicted RNA binding protein YcfA (HicA-like mRNA interferase family)